MFFRHHDSLCFSYYLTEQIYNEIISYTTKLLIIFNYYLILISVIPDGGRNPLYQPVTSEKLPGPILM